MGPTGGTYWWDLLVGPTGGTYWWDLLVGPTGGTYWWDLLVGPTGAVVPKLFFLVAPWLTVNPNRGPPALKQVTSSRIENKIIKIYL